MEYTKAFIVIYAIFAIITNLFGVVNAPTQPMFIPSGNPTLDVILTFASNVFSFFINLLLFSTGIFIIDGLLWGIRAIMILELLVYLKKLIHPTLA